MSLFKFVDEKDVFQQFYSRQLAKRLIFGMSVSIDVEVSMISRLKAFCGYEYTNKLQRMITDLTVSSEFSAKYHLHNKQDSGNSINGIIMKVYLCSIDFFLQFIYLI